ncbi:hypothetical protein SAY87_008608 [Trapa incisa]|uniref:C2 NT-type domain-containing protein n=1 Tax=Trapa incisa TaxID=236973 RepID=A0AAN7JV69_9MYRT|nr:hypothetical protein SAY87_008608 [Trapa incisa]
MVLGPKTSARKGPSVKLSYLVYILEVKPWPPSQTLKSLRSVQIQWENGEKNSGSTSSVIPSLGSGVNDGKIEFNESFRLPLTLDRNISVKAGNVNAFQKNFLEFRFYEPRRDKTLKGQLLGTAIIDLAEYGVIKGSLSINVPVNCQRNYKNTAQPFLHVKIQPVSKDHPTISLKNSLSKAASLEKNSADSVSDLIKEEYEETEINTFSDDDRSSHSSVAVSSSEPNGSLPWRTAENESNGIAKGVGGVEQILALETGHRTSNALPVTAAQEDTAASYSRSSSIDLSYDLGSPENGHDSNSSSPRSSSVCIQRVDVHSARFISPSLVDDHRQEVSISESLVHVDKGIGNGKMEIKDAACNDNDSSNSCSPNQSKAKECSALRDEVTDATFSVIEGNYPGQNEKIGDLEDMNSIDNGDERDSSYIGSFCFGSKNHGTIGTSLSNRLEDMTSVHSTSDSIMSNGMAQYGEEEKEVEVIRDVRNGERSFRTKESKDIRFYAKDIESTLLESKVQHLECRIQALESELREVAAIEVSIYSVIAEHGSSMAKVHAPARRLSRMYLNACHDQSPARKSSAARTIISGLVLITKACGNDVPRLTYWLSNSLALRTVISQAVENMEPPTSPLTRADRVDAVKGNMNASSLLRWESPLNKKNNDFMNSVNWKDPQTFISALEKVEAWIFSRTVESIWWQTLTPHMQCNRGEARNRIISPSSKNCSKEMHMDDQDEENLLTDHWKKAFEDALKRLCPVRAAGHECGCLPMLPRLIMEQCVSRLDVAMFNALLRESADEIPTDPISDPISDPKVLPVPAGQSSFGAGAQLKKAIGNWSRWLIDIFGMDDDSPEDEPTDDDDDDERQDSSFKTFYLLNALSDLMMLPKDMLLSKSIRKEVCPTFGTSLIRRVLSNFVPDEFCPDPIPKVVFQALDYEDPFEVETDSVTTYPYIASPPLYSPPSPASILGIIGETSGASILRKSYTSDDDLDELNFPIASILLEKPQSSPVLAKPGQIMEEREDRLNRYSLLRDVWINSE